MDDHVENSSYRNDEIKFNEKSSQKNYIKWTVALFITTIVISFYGDTEGQWFNSFMTRIAGYSDYHKIAMVSASAIIGTIAFLCWGAYSDNIRSKRGRRVPILTIGFLSTAFFVFLFGLGTNFWWLWLLDGILIGITSNMFHMASRALIPDLFPKSKRGKINTYLTIAGFMGTGLIWGLAVAFLPEGGGTIAKSQHQLIFMMCALFLVIGAIISKILIKEPDIQEPPRLWKEDLKKMFDRKEMSKHKDFMKLFIATLFTITANNAYTPWILEIFQDFSFESHQIILAGIILAVAIVPLVFFVGRFTDKLGRKKVVFVCLIYLTLGCLLIGFSNYNFYPGLTGLAMVLGGRVGFDIAKNTWIQDLLPEEARAKFLGIENIGRAAGQVPGAVVAAYFSINYGALSIFFVCAVFLIFSIPLFRRVPETL